MLRDWKVLRKSWYSQHCKSLEKIEKENVINGNWENYLDIIQKLRTSNITLVVRIGHILFNPDCTDYLIFSFFRRINYDDFPLEDLTWSSVDIVDGRKKVEIEPSLKIDPDIFDYIEYFADNFDLYTFVTKELPGHYNIGNENENRIRLVLVTDKNFKYGIAYVYYNLFAKSSLCHICDKTENMIKIENFMHGSFTKATR